MSDVATTVPVTIESQADFNQLVAEHAFAIVMFTATWCEPCQTLYPVFNAVAQRHADIRFAIADVDVAADLTANFQVTQVPALMVVRERVVVDMVRGSMHEHELEHHIQMWRGLDMSAITAHFDQQEAAAS